MTKSKKYGHGFYLPWWTIPIFIVVYPFAKVADWVTRGKLKKMKKDPHDISGEV